MIKAKKYEARILFTFYAQSGYEAIADAENIITIVNREIPIADAEVEWVECV